jgi:pyruvate,water dikinase
MQAEMMSDIAWFEEVRREALPLVGGKAANLGEMRRSGLPVPPGFVITTDAFRAFLGKDGLRRGIRDRLRTLDPDDPNALQSVSAALQMAVRDEQEPEVLRREIAAAYATLGERTGGGDALVAVRSSATLEDTAQYSFAGMFQSFLAVRGADELLRCVKACWASLFSTRVLFYRAKQGLVGKEQLIAVVVQSMVNADKSGVLFTVDPASGNPEVTVIESAWGLGETVVGGRVRPDRFVIAKRTGEIVERTINRKDVEIVRAKEGGQTERLVPPERQETPSLSDEEIRSVAELGRRAEEHYHSPQDVEFAIESGRVYLVQTWPVTTLKGVTPERRTSSGQPPSAILQGLGASPGIAAGRVRVLRSPEEGPQLERGEILVAPMTSPDWVPFMRLAAAVVTDSGGMTSHAAIVSRELGIPCIVGTQIATSTLSNGVTVTVAATDGLIYPGRMFTS